MLAPVTLTPVVADAPATIVRPAAGGAAIFSRYDPATKRYRLAELTADGRVITFRVPSRAVAFDVDVGPDVHGREVAVYSRCAREPEAFAPGGGLPYYRTGIRCRLYELSTATATGRERRLRTPDDGSGSDFLPSIWRGRLAWVHTASETAPVALMLRDGARTRRLRTGTPSADRRLGAGLRAPGVRGIDLRGDRLTFVWTYYDARKGCGDDPRFGRSPIDEVWSYRLGAARRRVAGSACPGDVAGRIHWSQLSPSGLAYATTTNANTETLVELPGDGAASRTTTLTLPAGTNFVQSFARLDDGALAVAWDGVSSGIAVAPSR
jgi:hypothetical protein